MITSDDLARLFVRRLIFHDVPKREKDGPVGPTLTNGETQLDRDRAAILKQRLTRVIQGSPSIEFKTDTASPIPPGVISLTNKCTSEEFVGISRSMASFLFEQQTGQISSGLLCVAYVTCGDIFGIAIMKLEREKGAKLDLVKQGDVQTFSMDVLNDLVLTDGTRLFKAALFLRDGGEFRAAACDQQNAPIQHLSIADFWMRFLGCKFVQSPALVTRDFFETTVRFVNQHVDDPVDKNTLYEHLASELKSSRSTVAPRKFLEECVKRDLRQSYTEALQESGISLNRFQKNTSEIEAKLKRKSFYTVNGVAVTAPADKEKLIEVGPDQIVVHDELKNIVER